MSDFLNTKELAVFLGVTVPMLEQWRKSKVSPPYIRVGIKRGRIIYQRNDVLTWLENNKVTA